MRGPKYPINKGFFERQEIPSTEVISWQELHHCHQDSHQEYKVCGITKLKEWRRGWDTHPGLLAILACFQQHPWQPHEYWRFLLSQILQLFNCSTQIAPISRRNRHHGHQPSGATKWHNFKMNRVSISRGIGLYQSK